jgi:CheY-like chemotaxis protein
MEAKVKVLVVDDDGDLVSVVADMLSQVGHEIATASSGHEAIAVAAAFEPDVALLDVLLPDINGITLAAVLKGVVEHKRLRVVALSGVGADRLQAATARGIFDAYLTKPVSLMAVEATLRGDRTGGRGQGHE